MHIAAKQLASSAKRAAVFALLSSLYGFMGDPAQAADDFYTFKSMLSSPNASWCIAVPQGDYQAGKHVLIASCNGRPNQIFGYEAGGSLTAGGFCLDGLAAAAGQPPAAGDAVGIAECTGNDQEVWELQPFTNRSDVFAIANPDGLCVTVDGATIVEGTPLTLAQCSELDTQGWLRGSSASSEPEFYWYSGHRYCWYDAGWHGGGWYWCGENFHHGIGWGGPIGWHWWHHHGHKPHLHLKPHKPPHKPPLKPPHKPPHKPPPKLHGKTTLKPLHGTVHKPPHVIKHVPEKKVLKKTNP